MSDEENSKSGHGPAFESIPHVTDWVDSRHPDSSTNELGSSPTAEEDLMAIYKCFDFLERVWPSDPDEVFQAGPFTLEEEIGRGGMGRVWLATQHEPVKRKVAVKLINPGPQSVQMVRRFEAERNVLALMNHPGIARLIDAGKTDEGQLYFAMELVEGPNLIEYCNENQLDINSRLELFLNACDAVQHAHQKGIIHRDLKPNNILVGNLNDQPHLKVIDFGLSKAEPMTQPLEPQKTDSESTQTEFTQHGQILGSVRYMSPEQAEGTAGSLDVRSDVYSLGVVLYRLLTDSVPLDARSLENAPVTQVLASIKNDADLKPSQLLADYPASKLKNTLENRRTSESSLQRVLKSDLDWIVMRAIEKAASKRYISVADFARDVRRFLNGEPIDAVPDSLLYRTRKEISRNRVLWSSVAAIILTLLTGIVVSGYSLTAANKERTLAERRLEYTRKSNEILSNIFSDLDPYAIEMGTQPFKVMVGAKLVGAAKGLDADSIGDPIEVAKLQIKLANALNGLERFDDAIPVAEKAFSTFDEADLEDKFNAGMTYGASLLGAAQTNAATDIIEPLLEESRLEHGEDSETFLELTLLKGRIAASLFNNNEARECFSQVASTRETQFGDSDLRTLDAKYWLADVYHELGNPDAGLPLYKDVLEKYRTLLPQGHPRTIKTLSNYAWMLSNSGQFGKAKELAREGMDLAIATFGDNNPATHDMKLTLGLVTHRKGSHTEGVRLIEEAWLGLSETTGLRHPRAISARLVLASVNRQAGKFSRAIDLYEEALALSEVDRNIEIRLASIYLEVGEFERARELLQATMANKPDAGTQAKCLYEIGCSLESEGNYIKAIETLERSLKLALQIGPKYHFPVMRTKLMLARSYSRNGDSEKATQIIKDYLADMPDSMGPKNNVRLCCRAELGVTYREAGKDKEALAELQSVAKTGVILLHQDLLIREIRHAQLALGEKASVLSSIDKELNYLRRSFPADSFFLAKRLNRLGYDMIEFGLLEKAKELLAESILILEDQKPNSWKLEMTRFDLARVALEHEPADSEAGQMASIELEEAWQELEPMITNAFPIETKALADSIKEVARIYGLESDQASQEIWTNRLSQLGE